MSTLNAIREWIWWRRHGHKTLTPKGYKHLRDALPDIQQDIAARRR